MITKISSEHASFKRLVLLPSIFLLVAVVGLYIVKWGPYYHKAALAFTTHSIGSSIITGAGATAPDPSWGAALSFAGAYFKAVWKAMVLGLVLGSLVQVIVPKDWISRAFGRPNLSSTALAGAAALPGMMCSCCAAPVAAGLRARSASVGSTLAFLLGSPVLNPATIIFMGFVLSWKFAIFRIIVGVVMVLGLSTLADRIAGGETVPASVIEDEAMAQEGNLLHQWARALVRLALDSLPAYVIFVLLLGAARAWLFPAVSPDWGSSVLLVLGMAVAGTLFVIPTAAEIPVIQTLMSVGLGVGPAAALLMTLPAISLPSVLIIKNALPAGVLIFTLVSVALVGIASGLIAPVLL